MARFYGYIESSKDAILLIEAARPGYVGFIRQKLTMIERDLIKPGSCFIWDVTNSSLRRWTDGKHWSPSRYYKNFFSYYQVYKSSELMASQVPLLKRSFSITGIDGRRYQIINYLHAKKELNFNLPRINESDLAQVVIPINYYIKPQSLLSKPKKSIVPELSSESSTVYPLDSNCTQNTLKSPPITSFSYELPSFCNSFKNACLNKNSPPASAIEQCCLTRALLYHPEDLRQLSLLGFSPY